MNRDADTSRGVVVFDLDGTLVDTSEDIAFTINHLRQRQGLAALKTDEILKAVGLGAPFLLRNMLEIDSSKPDITDHWLSAFQTHYMQHQGERSHLYPGIDAALEALRAFADLYVLSNKPHDATVQEVNKKGIHHHFESIWGAGQFSALKPDPAGIHAACKISDAPHMKAVMIGDLWVDIQAGLNAGVHTIFVGWGFGSDLPRAPAPTRAVSTPRSIPETVRQLIS